MSVHYRNSSGPVGPVGPAACGTEVTEVSATLDYALPPGTDKPKDVTCVECLRLIAKPLLPQSSIHYRTVPGTGPAACGVVADILDGGCTSILDRVTCEACKKAAPGMKYDGEKARMSLLPFHALELVAQVMTYGARKYSPWNWTRLADAEERYANAMLRHFAAWQGGERFDNGPGGSGLPHLACVACNALFLLAFGEKTRDLDCGKRPEEK